MSIADAVVDERKSEEEDGVGALILRMPMEEVVTDAGVEKADTEAELSHKQERRDRAIVAVDVVGLQVQWDFQLANSVVMVTV